VLLREAADGRAVEGQVVRRLEQELLVVVQHVQPALEVGEAHRHRLEPALVGQVLDALLAHLADVHALDTLALGFQVHLLELVVRDLEEVPKPGPTGQVRVLHVSSIDLRMQEFITIDGPIRLFLGMASLIS
jgi:hypothetical protein